MNYLNQEHSQWLLLAFIVFALLSIQFSWLDMEVVHWFYGQPEMLDSILDLFSIESDGLSPMHGFFQLKEVFTNTK